MANQAQNIPQHDPNQPSLLIAAHCSTIERKTKRIDAKELSAILDDLIRELHSLNSKIYLTSLNEIIKTLNTNFPRVLSQISSHYFFPFLRNVIRDLLQQFYTYKQLNDQEMYALRNTTVLINHFVEKTKDVSKILHWITDETFLDSLAKSLKYINKTSKADENKYIIKQTTRLLNMFCDIQKRLPIHLHQTLFVRLLRPVIHCLTSGNYVKLFKSLKPNAESFTDKQKLFLIKCPSFLTSYNGPHMDKALEQVLEVLLPRYVTILKKHIKTVKEWNRPMIHAIHNLIRTIIYAQGYFSSYTNNKSFRSLIDQLLYLLNESVLINKIKSDSKNTETLLIESILSAFNVLVDEPNALDYIKQCKPVTIFQQLLKTSNENIILSSYSMLVYTIDENDLTMLENDLLPLLFSNLNLLQKAMGIRSQGNSDRENIDRNITQLVQILKGLIQYEQIKNEILQQGLLTFLIDCHEKLHGLSKQLVLECLWSLSFNEQIAQQLREHQQFIFSLENVSKNMYNNTQENITSSKNCSRHRRNETREVSNEAMNYGIQKVMDGVLWNVVQEPIFREKFAEKMSTETKTYVTAVKQKYKYDIMMSYCDADKDIVHKIQQFLIHQGYNIWLDSDQNYGHEIIAEAIENSEVVIICMSDLYKQDNHCRAEAEYALNSKRFLLPVNLRNNYKPDGWLTSIIGNNTYIDFGRSDFKTAYKLLSKKIKQRQRQKEILYDKPTISMPVYIAYDASIAVNKQQEPETPNHYVSRSSTPRSTVYTESEAVDTQQQTSMQSISRSPTPSFISEAVDTQQQPRISTYPVLRSSIPSYISSYSSATAEKQQQTTIQPLLRALSPEIATPTTSMVIDKQQDQIPIEPVSLLPRINSSSFTVSSVVDAQQQQEPVHSILQPLISMQPVLKLSTSTTNSFDASINVERKQQEIPVQPVSQSSTTNSTSHFPSITTVEQQQQPQQTQMHPALWSQTPGTISFDESVDINKQQQQPIQMYPTSRLPMSNTILPAAPTAAVRQQPPTSVHHPPRSLTNDLAPFPASFITDKQSQQTPIISNSKLSIPAALPAVSYINSALPTSSETNGQEQPQLPEEYATRKTNNSTYRSLSINAWRNNDVLDFLCDLNLYLMMPLCESMSGRAFTQLFRMCQAKPSRLYGLLNEELRVRFKGLTLPMGIYTQFLVEMDALVGPALDTIPLIPPSTPKNSERVKSVPQIVPLQPVPVKLGPRLSTHPRISPIQWKDIAPIETKSNMTSARIARIIERAVSSTGAMRQTMI